MGRLRAYGNAIVPQVAAQVIAAYIERVEALGGWYQANGVADLAMKHRNIAEKEAGELRAALARAEDAREKDGKARTEGKEAMSDRLITPCPVCGMVRECPHTPVRCQHEWGYSQYPAVAGTTRECMECGRKEIAAIKWDTVIP